MVMLLLVAAMAILMEYSLSKVILCIQNKKCKSPSTPYTKSKQVGTVYTRGDRVAITSAEETGTFFCRGSSAPHFVTVCSTDGLVASSVVMGYAGSHPVFTHPLSSGADSETVFHTGGLLDFSTASASTIRVLLSLLSGFLFCSVSCLSLQSSQVSVKILRMFLNPSVKIDLQKSTGYALCSFTSEQDELDAVL